MVHIYYFEDLICLEIGNEITEDDLGNYLESFENHLQTSKKFGLLFNYINNKPKKNVEVKKIERIWIKRNKDKLKEKCFGIAMISNQALLPLLEKISTNGFGKNYFGCNCNSFKNSKKAIQWLKKIKNFN